MPERSLVRIADRDLGAIRAALRVAGLPVDDLPPGANCFELREAGEAIAWAALECFGENALLRSVVVTEAARGNGAGADLVGRVAQAASESGVRRLWLLTETAEAFFHRLGFERIERDEAPAAIRRTTEFEAVCPASAACMTARLR